MIFYTTLRRVIPESDLFPGAGEIVITCFAPVEITEAKIQEEEKELDKLYDLVLAKNLKLANDKFLAKAPVEIIKKEFEALWSLESKYHAKATNVKQWREAIAGSPCG